MKRHNNIPLTVNPPPNVTRANPNIENIENYFNDQELREIGQCLEESDQTTWDVMQMLQSDGHGSVLAPDTQPDS